MKLKIVNKRKFIKSITTLILSIVFTILFIVMTIEFINYPVKYLTTWRYQLHQEVNAGNQEAINYYKTTYLDHNITLWD